VTWDSLVAINRLFLEPSRMAPDRASPRCSTGALYSKLQGTTGMGRRVEQIGVLEALFFLLPFIVQ